MIYAVPERLLIMANGYNPVDVEEVIQVRCAYGTDRRVLGPQLWNTFRAAYCCDIPDSSDLEYECNSDSCQASRIYYVIQTNGQVMT
jgi:hypothetical protein